MHAEPCRKISVQRDILQYKLRSSYAPLQSAAKYSEHPNMLTCIRSTDHATYSEHPNHESAFSNLLRHTFSLFSFLPSSVCLKDFPSLFPSFLPLWHAPMMIRATPRNGPKTIQGSQPNHFATFMRSGPAAGSCMVRHCSVPEWWLAWLQLRWSELKGPCHHSMMTFWLARFLRSMHFSLPASCQQIRNQSSPMMKRRVNAAAIRQHLAQM